MATIFRLIAAIIAVFIVGYFIFRLLIPRFSPTPDDLGVTDGRLSPCPNTPNCVSSQAEDKAHSIASIPYSSSTTEAHDKLRRILRNMPRTVIITDQPTYIHVETRSSTMGYIDDNEFFFDEAAGLLHIRAAARLGREDFNANRNRMEGIRQAFNKD